MTTDETETDRMEPKRADGPAAAPKIAMWGAPGSGKTTFLAALNVALNRKGDGWMVIGDDRPSTDALVRMTQALVTDRRFPKATEGIERYRWFLVRQAGKEAGRRQARRKAARTAHRIGLDLLDPSGEIYGQRRSGSVGSDELVDNLVHGRGIIYLFDPVREFEEGDAYDFLHGVLAQLAQQMLDSPDFTGGYLPHHLAICVTKFDDIRILEAADKLQLVDADPDDSMGFPRVNNEDARELFRSLCDVSASGNAELVLNMLEQYFHRDRIRYFVTSAIGFHVDPEIGIFDPEDYQNLIPEESGSRKFRIRGTIHPINVVEPLLWLGRQIAPERI